MIKRNERFRHKCLRQVKTDTPVTFSPFFRHLEAATMHGISRKPSFLIKDILSPPSSPSPTQKEKQQQHSHRHYHHHHHQRNPHQQHSNLSNNYGNPSKDVHHPPLKQPHQQPHQRPHQEPHQQLHQESPQRPHPPSPRQTPSPALTTTKTTMTTTTSTALQRNLSSPPGMPACPVARAAAPRVPLPYLPCSVPPSPLGHYLGTLASVRSAPFFFPRGGASVQQCVCVCV